MKFLIKFWRYIRLKCTVCGENLLDYSDRISYCEGCLRIEGLKKNGNK